MSLPAWLDRTPILPAGTPRTVRLMPPDVEARRKGWKSESWAERGKRISEGKRKASLARKIAHIEAQRAK